MILAAVVGTAAWFSFKPGDPAFPDRPEGGENPEPPPTTNGSGEVRDANVPPAEILPVRAIEYLLEEGETKRALAAIEQVVKKEPKDAFAWTIKAKANLDLQLWRQSEKDYGKAMEVGGETVQRLDGRATALAMLRKEKEAEQLLRRSLELDPARARPHSLLAKIHLRNGRIKEAAAEAKKALDLDPAEPMALAVERTLESYRK